MKKMKRWILGIALGCLVLGAQASAGSLFPEIDTGNPKGQPHPDSLQALGAPDPSKMFKDHQKKQLLNGVFIEQGPKNTK